MIEYIDIHSLLFQRRLSLYIFSMGSNELELLEARLKTCLHRRIKERLVQKFVIDLKSCETLQHQI